MLSTVLDEYEKSIHYVEIDIAKDPEIAESAGIMALRACKFLKIKPEWRSSTGVKMKSEYRKIFSEQLIESSAA